MISPDLLWYQAIAASPISDLVASAHELIRRSSGNESVTPDAKCPARCVVCQLGFDCDRNAHLDAICDGVHRHTFQVNVAGVVVGCVEGGVRGNGQHLMGIVRMWTALSFAENLRASRAWASHWAGVQVNGGCKWSAVEESRCVREDFHKRLWGTEVCLPTNAHILYLRLGDMTPAQSVRKFCRRHFDQQQCIPCCAHSGRHILVTLANPSSFHSHSLMAALSAIV